MPRIKKKQTELGSPGPLLDDERELRFFLHDIVTKNVAEFSNGPRLAF